MFVSIVLNTEYMDVDSRIKWYAKSLSVAKKLDLFIITHESFARDRIRLLNQIPDRFYEEFEMRRLTSEEIDLIPHYYIPDSFFEENDLKFGSRTAALLNLFANRNFKLEEYLHEGFRKAIGISTDGRISAAFHSLESFKSIRATCDQLKIPLINYVFSAIRRVHGYRHTLYFAELNGSIFNSTNCNSRYNRYLNERPDHPILEHRDVIGLFGKDRNLHLLPYIDHDCRYQLGICSEGYEIVPQVFGEVKYSTDDIIYDANKCFTKAEQTFRLHPNRLKNYNVRSEHLADPIFFIINSKRIAAVCSQIMLKGILWNRVVVNKKQLLPFGFACEKQIDSNKKVDMLFHNYLFMTYLVPESLMFNKEYWLWRLKNPDELCIRSRHIKQYEEDLGLIPDTLSIVDSDERFKKILMSRDLSEFDIISICDPIAEKPPLNSAEILSSIQVIATDSDGQTWLKKIYRRVQFTSSYERSVNFQHYSKLPVSSLTFIPFLESSGTIKLLKFEVLSSNGEILTDNLTNDILEIDPSGFTVKLIKSVVGKFVVKINWETLKYSNQLTH